MQEEEEEEEDLGGGTRTRTETISKKESKEEVGEAGEGRREESNFSRSMITDGGGRGEEPPPPIFGRRASCTTSRARKSEEEPGPLDRRIEALERLREAMRREEVSLDELSLCLDAARRVDVDPGVLARAEDTLGPALGMALLCGRSSSRMVPIRRSSRALLVPLTCRL